MSLELLNTSAPRGVRPGSSGFCTVGVTAGMPAALEERLTLLSGYRWLTPPGEPRPLPNPVAFSHWRLPFGPRTLSVLSRVADAGVDHTRRSNRLAHHLALEDHEQSEAGPAWVMLQPGVMREACPPQPMVFAHGADIPAGVSVPRVCRAWQAACGDAGWAGVVAQAAAADPTRIITLVYAPPLAMLPLIDEALSLLPAAMRWQITFSTYFNELPAGMAVAWRCCVAATRAAEEAIEQGGMVIDLRRPLPPAADSPHVFAARHGTAVQTPLLSPSNGAGLRRIDPAAPVSLREPVEEAASSPMQPPPDGEGPAVEIAPAPAASSGGLNAARSTGFPTRMAAAIAWPIVVAAGVVWYVRHQPPPPPPAFSAGMIPPRIVGSFPRSPIPLPAEREPPPPAVSAATAPSATSSVEDDRLMTTLRQRLQETRDDLAAERIRAASIEAELQQLRAAAPPPAPSPATGPATAAAVAPAVASPAPQSVDRTVDLFSDEVELWAGDSASAPDGLRLLGATPPQGLIVDASRKAIALKSQPSGGGRLPPTELAIIRLSDARVTLKWVANRAQLPAPCRGWLQLAGVDVQRRGQTIGSIRFLPLHEYDVWIDDEASAPLLAEVRWKPAYQQVALGLPRELPAGWTAALRDRTLTLTHSPSGAAFDVELMATENELRAQTNFSAAFYRASEKAKEVLLNMPLIRVPLLTQQTNYVLATLALRRGRSAVAP